MVAVLTKLWNSLNGLLYCALGIFTLLKPLSLAETLGYELKTPTALPELKATYGGLMLSIGLLLGILTFYHQLPKTALFILLLTYTGFFIGRLLGGLSAGEINNITLLYLGIEGFGITLSSILYFLSQPT